jgi:hypothetical protein
VGEDTRYLGLVTRGLEGEGNAPMLVEKLGKAQMGGNNESGNTETRSRAASKKLTGGMHTFE